jgi:hypothetical protein
MAIFNNESMSLFLQHVIWLSWLESDGGGNLLVLPAASNPSIRMRISLLPNIFPKAFDTLAPMVKRVN